MTMNQLQGIRDELRGGISFLNPGCCVPTSCKSLKNNKAP
jgi:hypothetical protein